MREAGPAFAADMSARAAQLAASTTSHSNAVSEKTNHNGNAQPVQPLLGAHASLRWVPTPLIMLDSNKLIQVVSRKAEEILDLRQEDLLGHDANDALQLSAKGISRQFSLADRVVDTRLSNGRRILFEVSHVFQNENDNLNNTPIDARSPIVATYLSVAKCWRLGTLVYPVTAPESGSSPGMQSERAWAEMQTKMLDMAPMLIVAVSKDGRHIYQNQEAFNTLGPQQQSQNGLADWIKRQYAGAMHPDGTEFVYNELPLYRASIDGEPARSVDVLFGNYYYNLTGLPLYDSHGEHVGGIAFSQDITDLKTKAKVAEQRALAQSDIKFANIADQMQQIVFMSAGDRITYLNASWYRVTGATPEQSLGHGWYDFLHPDDVEPCKAMWKQTISSSAAHVFQQRVLAADGTYRTYLARANALVDDSGKVEAWIGVGTDVTQLSDALEQAKLAKEHLYSMIQFAHVHYFVVDTERRLTWLVLAGQNVVPYGTLRSDAPIGSDVGQFLPSQVYDKLCGILSGQVASSTDIFYKDGVWWKTQLKAVQKQANGAITSVVCTCIDVTDDRLKDEQLARAATDREVAVQNSKFKSDFLARMSHEIRTPVGGVLGMVQLMKDAFHPDDKRQIFLSRDKEDESLDYLESIKRSGDALLVIINDILDFSKIEVGKMDIESSPFDLYLAIKDVFNSCLHGPHKTKNVEFSLEYLIPEQMIFRGDSNRIRQIVTNLTANALKFTEEGKVTLRVTLDNDPQSGGALSPPPATNGRQVDPFERVKIEIIDTGLGIPKTTLEKLFNPFVQADSSTARKFGGTGLGLSIAKQLVKLMSGALTLESVPSPEPGHGSTAKCILPLEQSSRKALEQLQPAKLIKFEQDFNVLLVEDNKINQKIARKVLEKIGLRCDIRENGQECLDYLESQVSRLPSLILMDCQMPVMDGYDATRRIRKHPNRSIRSLPIVAMTASAIRGDRERCIDAGMQDYVSKPVNLNLLSATLRKYLLPEPGKQTTANVIMGNIANTRPSKESILEEAAVDHVAGKDPHLRTEASNQETARDEHIVDLDQESTPTL
ncbi:hypothetical protein PYCC9005_002861 [Savitreella phatthalungensis]